MNPKSVRRILAASAALLTLAALPGCRVDNVFFSVKNASGESLHDVKVTYPGDVLDVGTLDGKLDTATIYGKFGHFDGPGFVSVTYTTERGNSYSHSGPHVNGSEKGDVKINIEGSSADFEMNLDPSRQ